MKTNHIIIVTCMLSFSLYAMERLDENNGRAGVACPGARLAAASDVRHRVAVEFILQEQGREIRREMRQYNFIDLHGDGLTTIDIKLLREIVPFAIELSHEYKIRFKSSICGLFVGGVCYSILAFLTPHLIQSPEWRHGVGICSMLIGALLGYFIPSSRRTLNEENALKARIHTLVNRGKVKVAESDCRHEQTLEKQKEHLLNTKVARMAIGKLHVPTSYAGHACFDQIATDDRPYQPLQYVLLQKGNLLNKMLNIPKQYRCNSTFVSAFMDIIEESEK